MKKLIILNLDENGNELRDEFTLPNFESDTYDFGKKKTNLLKNGMYLRSINIFESGHVRAMGSYAITGKGSGYSFPCAAKEWIETI